MDETLKYNTPNSEKILKQIGEFEFNRVWKKNLKKNTQNLIIGVLCLIVSIFFLLQDVSVGIVMMFVSIGVLISYFNYQSNYNQIKKQFEQNLSLQAELLNKNSKDVFWEFAPDYFRFTNYNSDLKFSWSQISYDVIDEKYLYITAKFGLNFILDKANVDAETFQRTINYLKTKSQKINVKS